MAMGHPHRGHAAPAPQAPGPEPPPAPASENAAFAAFVEPYVQRLHRFLVLRLGDERDARDALQETLLAAWQGLPRLRERDRPWSWLVGIAAHKASDSARRRPRSVPLTSTEEAREDDGAADVVDALERLPTGAREVLLLRYLLRLSEVEVAEVLGVRVGTVKSRAARARARLLEELQ
jgi:RNA polymerase sigma-70 factor (ECF subfamily)